MHFYNVSELLDLKDSFGQVDQGAHAQEWSHFPIDQSLGGWGRKRAAWRQAFAAVRQARQRPDAVLVSHLPGSHFRVELARRLWRHQGPHLAFALNFSRLPLGWRRRLWGRIYRGIDHYVVFSRHEVALYAQYFGLPHSRFVFLPWTCGPPLCDPEVVAPLQGDYLVALGGEGRDYATLFAAAELCPEIQILAILRPANLRGLTAPPNVTVRCNLPSAQAWGLVGKSLGMVLPLLSDSTPNGHVTLVGAQLLGVGLAVTDSRGVADYTGPDEALLVPAQDAPALACAMRALAAQGPEVAARCAQARLRARARSDPAQWEAFFTGLRQRGQGLDA